jgi:hypothetical protein
MRNGETARELARHITHQRYFTYRGQIINDTNCFVSERTGSVRDCNRPARHRLFAERGQTW